MLQGGSDNLVFCCLVEYLEYPEVEDDHDQAGDVEGPDTGPNDEVRIVEGADERLWLFLAWLTDNETCVEAERLIDLIDLTTIISVKQVS